MKNFLKKSVVLVFALAVCFTTVFANVGTVKAGESLKTIYQSKGEYAIAGKSYVHNVTLKNADRYLVEVAVVPEKTEFNLDIYNNSNKKVKSFNVSTSSSKWVVEQQYYFYVDVADLSNGDYKFKITFKKDVAYALGIYQQPVKASLSATSVTITKGFSKTIKVDNGKVTKWSTSNNKVATVSKGKIVGKKAGKCNVTATLSTGKKLTCKVYIKDNVFSAKKLSVSSVGVGRYAQVYNAKYDSKGNLILKVRIVNNTSQRYTQLRNVKIVMKTSSKKTIGTYKLSKKNVTISGYSSKDFSFKISKSNVKVKNADLRNSKCTTCTGTLYYIY